MDITVKQNSTGTKHLFHLYVEAIFREVLDEYSESILDNPLKQITSIIENLCICKENIFMEKVNFNYI